MAAPCQDACHLWNLALPGKWCQMSTSKSGRNAHRRCQVMKSTAALRRFPKQTRASAWPVPRNAACLWSRASVGGTPSPRSLCIPAEEVSQARIPQTCCRMGLRKGAQIYRKALTASSSSPRHVLAAGANDCGCGISSTMYTSKPI